MSVVLFVLDISAFIWSPLWQQSGLDDPLKLLSPIFNLKTMVEDVTYEDCVPSFADVKEPFFVSVGFVLFWA